MTDHRVLNDESAPTVWPACDCGAAYVYRRALHWTKGFVWVWQADCKHPKKETHAAVLMTADGPYEPPTTEEHEDEDQP